MIHDDIAWHPWERLLQNGILAVNGTLIPILLVVERWFERLSTELNIIAGDQTFDSILVLLNNRWLLELLSTLHDILQHQWRKQSLWFTFFLILLEPLIQVLIYLELILLNFLMTGSWLDALKDFLSHFILTHLRFVVNGWILWDFAFCSDHLWISTLKYSGLIGHLIGFSLVRHIGEYGRRELICLCFLEII